MLMKMVGHMIAVLLVQSKNHWHVNKTKVEMLPLAIRTVSSPSHSSVPHSIHLPQASYLSYTEKRQ